MTGSHKKVWVVAGLSAVGYLLLAYTRPAPLNGWLLPLYAGIFACYLYLTQHKSSVWFGIGTAMAFRALLLFALPAYPVATQELWWQSLTSSSVYGVRAFWILGEFGSILLLLRLLRKMGLPDKHLLWYALNPVVILSLTLYLHPYNWLIFFLLLSLYLLNYQKHVLAGLAFALTIALAPIHLLLLPLLLKRIKLKCFGLFTIGLSGSGAIIYLLVQQQVVWQHAFIPVAVPFEGEVFNASIFPVLQLLSQMCGPGCSQLPVVVVISTVAVAAVLLAYFKALHSLRRLTGYMATVLTIFLLLSRTVYSWQLVPLLVLTCLSHFRFAIVWTAMVILLYLPGYEKQEALFVVLEYSLVLIWLVVEIYLYRQRRILHNLQPKQSHQKGKTVG
ncbi:hypothetical protein FVR03_02860 [Pontibacter qinzhouensis]|uniref:DUF2029 domain-containing protein n=1 Tax=Pontibacter qinzhouensis TaxID=2603253 RepID=A0A5C8KCZ1_9BACT|nr:hypothetical protein [Pontibacter qinzhouensis]TXK51892.1 hypothetical protein FVR03_02860 [Pontibacter qinzhouensis]